MSARPSFDERPEQDGTQFNWESPRWRESHGLPDEVERARRFKGDFEPSQRGAIDEGGSVRGSASSADRTAAHRRRRRLPADA